MTAGELMEAIKAVAAVSAMLGGMGAVLLWAMRAIIRAELKATCDSLIRIEAEMRDHERRLDHIETKVDDLAKA